MRQFLKAYVYPICFGIGLCLQLFHTYTFFTYQGSDRNLQILAGINLSEGHGYSIQEANIDDLSETIYTSLKGWPPGYSLLVIPFYLLTGDGFLSAEILAYLSIFLCFSGAHFLLKELKPLIHRWVYPAFFLGWGIFFTPFHFTAVADEWALGFFIWGTVFWLKVILHDDQKWFGWIVVSTLFFWLAAIMRYAYYPILLIPMILESFRWLIGRQKNLRLWLSSSLFALISFISLWMISTPMVGTVNSFTEVYGQPKIHWENLAFMDAFPVKTFFYLSVEGIANKLGGISPILGSLMKIAMLGLSVFLLSFLFPFYEKKKFWRSPVMLYLVLLGGIIASMLIFLSLKAPATIYGDFIWTYVRETRFYAPVLVGLQIYFWHLFFEDRLIGVRKWGLRLFLITGVLYSLGHATYRYGQRYLAKDYRETRYALVDQGFKTLSQEINDFSTLSIPVTWVYEVGILPEDEAAVVGWQGYKHVWIDDLIENGIQTEKPINLILKIKPEKRALLVKKNPAIDWSTLTPIILSESDTLYQLLHDPHEN